MIKLTYSSGQIAHLCGVSPRTVAKWIDSDELKGFKLPGSDHRRVHHEDLVSFMKLHGYQTDSLEQIDLTKPDNTGSTLQEFRDALEQLGPLATLWEHQPVAFVQRLILRCACAEDTVEILKRPRYADEPMADIGQSVIS